MRVSVILSTYNEPDRLELALWGYSGQTHTDFEIVLADDGSTPRTRERIEAVRRATDLEIRHVWHEDRGFRKCRILNRAIAAARSEYLVFSDGDCVPRRDFVATHARLAARGRFVSGGRCNLARHVSEAMEPANIVDGRVFDTGWWLRRNGPSLRPLLKIVPGSKRGRWLDRITSTRATWNGHNASGWKDDIVAVNGFDERLGYGGEDRELGERLRNYGIRPLQARHRAVVLHLDHPRAHVDHDSIRSNLEVRRRTSGVPRWLSRWEGFAKGPMATDFGIRQLSRGLLEGGLEGGFADGSEAVLVERSVVESSLVESSSGTEEALSSA